MDEPSACPSPPGRGSDDKVLKDLSVLETAREVLITEKMDGENTTLHSGGYHARSLDSRYHPSRDWVKAFAAGISPQLAEGERIVGEYLYAQHSVSYADLPSYFLGFAWIVDQHVQAWDATLARFEELGITPVKALYRGPFSAPVLDAQIAALDLERQEGFVAPVAQDFPEDDMQRHIAKYVRAGHVQSEVHWMQAELIKNRLA